MVDASLILDAIVAVSIAAGAFFAIWELHEIRQDRRTQIVLDLMGTFSSREFQEQYGKVDCRGFKNGKEAEEKCGRRNLAAVATYFERLGYLIRRGLIDRDAVFEMLQIAATWDMMKPWIMSESVRGGDPSVFEHFERAAEMERAWADKKRKKGV